MLRIAVLSNSGNVGKSMICETLLKPRIPDCELIKIETINSDGHQDDKLSAKEIDEIFSRINISENCLLDIGASNIELFLENMNKVDGAIEDIDWFFVPTTTASKQQQDALNTIVHLIELGVNTNNIKIIFNYFDPSICITRQYPAIFNHNIANSLGLSDSNNQFTIEESHVFEFLSKTGVDYQKALNDPREFKQLIRATKDKEERSLLSLEQMTHRFCKGFDRELNETFDKIKEACDFDMTINE